MNFPDYFFKIIKIFKKYKIDFMVAGGISAIAQGYDGSTQDVDLYVKNSKENCEKIILALSKLKVKLSDKDKEDIKKAKDFIQFSEPYDIDLMFYPDGFDSYEKAKSSFYKEIEGIPFLSLRGIIQSKKSANRPKDRAVLPILLDLLKSNSLPKNFFEKLSLTEYFKIPKGFRIADNQTLVRWNRNNKRSLKERINKGLW